MNKKEYILKVLDKLGEYRPIARGLKVLLNQDKLDDEQVNGLLSIFENVMKQTSDKVQKEKIQKGIDAIKRFQLLEQEQSQQDAKDVQDLEELIKNI